MEVELARLDVFEDIVVVHPVDRGLPRHQHEEDNSQGPDVAPLVVAAGEYFGGHVVGSAHQHARLLLPEELLPEVLLPPEGQPEVYQHQVQLLPRHQQKVLRL